MTTSVASSRKQQSRSVGGSRWRARDAPQSDRDRWARRSPVAPTSKPPQPAAGRAGSTRNVPRNLTVAELGSEPESSMGFASLVDDGAVAVIQVEELGQLGGRGLAVVAALLVGGQEGDGQRGLSGGGMGAHAIAANGQLAGITHGCHQTGCHPHPCPVTGGRRLRILCDRHTDTPRSPRA